MPNKKIIILIMVILSAGTVASGFYYFLKNKTGEPLPPKLTASQTCNQPAGRAKDLCLKETALSQADSEVCQKISDDGLKADCLKSVNLYSAVRNKDLAACQKLDNLMLSKTCLERIIKYDYEKADCKLLGQNELAVFCLSEKNGALARKNNDAKLCEQIPESIKKANCLSELKHLDLHSDADKDGLDFLQEIINGANPDNPDTDGDGQLDGVEVAAGHSPNGSGELSQTMPANFIECDSLEDIQLRISCLMESGDGGIDIANCDTIKSLELLSYCLKQQQSFFSQSAGKAN